MGFKEDIGVDKYSLDTCWEEQATFLMQYSELSNDANVLKDHAEMVVEKKESEIKEITAQLTLDVKFKFKDYGFDKPPSDTTAAAWAITQNEYKVKLEELISAKEDLIDKRNKSYRLRNAVSAFADRKAALQHLQTLFLNNYYADDRGKGNDFNERMSRRK